MILITKPVRTPADLRAGAGATQANNAQYDVDPGAYRAGSISFAFKSSIYGSKAVKNALKKAQYEKCCYCEAVFDANYSGDVEHYRPKGAIGHGSSKILPGYYWLAYSWSNLYYACADCNQYRKRAAFPLADESMRVFDHHGEIAQESPLILDPGGPPDPRKHIQFNMDVPTWSTTIGETTIKSLKLDREPLCLSRRKHFRLLDALLTIIRLNKNDSRQQHVREVNEARAKLLLLMQPTAEFSAAAQDYLEPFRELWDVAPLKRKRVSKNS